jgi:hypothetical protein
MLQIIAEVPQCTVRRVIDGVCPLLEALSNARMLKGAVRLMENCLHTMESHARDYTETERQGLAFALQILRDGRALLKRIGTENFPSLMKGITAVESDWYESVLKEAGRNRTGV